MPVPTAPTVRPIRSATLLLLGFGSVGRGLLPLLRRHLDLTGCRVVVVSAEDAGRAEALDAGAQFVRHAVLADDHQAFLARWLQPGDLLLNLSVDVSSVALLHWCQGHAVDYIDSYIEPWRVPQDAPSRPGAGQTNYALRQPLLPLRQALWQSTALVMHGANPGLSFHFLRQGLLELAARHGVPASPGGAPPADAPGWARLAQTLDIRVIQVAERDSQVDGQPRQRGEFVNTWSTSGFLAESAKPVEVGWGSHEQGLPPGAREHAGGHASSVYFDQPGASRSVRSWTPRAGPGDALLIGLSDAVTMSEYLTVRDPAGALAYRPTVCYAYRPCDATAEALREQNAVGGRPPDRQRLLKDTLVGGADELGVLLVSPRFGAHWYGSYLTLAQARALAPCNNATTLQVAAGVLAGLEWVLDHPRGGLLEPRDLPHDTMLEAARPYLGEMHGAPCDWRAVARGTVGPCVFAQFSPG